MSGYRLLASTLCRRRSTLTPGPSGVSNPSVLSQGAAPAEACFLATRGWMVLREDEWEAASRSLTSRLAEASLVHRSHRSCGQWSVLPTRLPFRRMA